MRLPPPTHPGTGQMRIKIRTVPIWEFCAWPLVIDRCAGSVAGEVRLTDADAAGLAGGCLGGRGCPGMAVELAVRSGVCFALGVDAGRLRRSGR